VESPIEHPVTMTHAPVALDALEKVWITPNPRRTSEGTEDVEGLIVGPPQALEGM
jgi:cystathionine beta-lyase/cystathionine gamma-synthase